MTENKSDMAYLCQLIKDRSGLILEGHHEDDIQKKLSPLVHENGFKTIQDLIKALRQGRAGLITQVLHKILNHETGFYRDSDALEGLQKLLKVKFKNLRVWCAGCSWGQEAYTVAFMLNDSITHMIATDMDSTVIDHAKRGLYTENDLEKIPMEKRDLYFKKFQEEWKVNSIFRHKIKFQVHNLLDDFKPLGSFDVILCRQVLCGFDQKLKAKIIHLFLEHLNPQGYFVVGKKESLMGYTSGLQALKGLRGIYQRTES